MGVQYRITGALIIVLIMDKTPGSHSTEFNYLYFDFRLSNTLFFGLVTAVQNTAICSGCVPSEESWKGVSGSWVRNSEVGAAGRNVTQNRSKSSWTSSHTGRTFTKSVYHVSQGGWLRNM